MLGSASAGNSALVATDHCKILVRYEEVRVSEGAQDSSGLENDGPATAKVNCSAHCGPAESQRTA
jgi:hypothetical protein